MKKRICLFVYCFGLSICAFLVIFSTFPNRLEAATQNNQFLEHPIKKRVLVLNSYHMGFKWSDDIMEAIRDTFASDAPGIELYFEYLDTKRFPDRDYWREIYSALILKYKGLSFDLIMTSDNNALEFILRFRSPHFSNVPIVFCGVNYFKPKDIEGYDNITGIAEQFNLKGTIELALQLRPETTELVFIVGPLSIKSHRLNLEQIQRIIPQFKDRLKIEILQCSTMKEGEAKVRRLPSSAAIFLLGRLTDSEGKLVTPLEQGQRLSEISNAPIYTVWDFYLGSGVVGGLMLNGADQGKAAAAMAIKILKGMPVHEIPVLLESPSSYMFDYVQMKHFGIKIKALPEKSLIIHQPISFYEKHKEMVWALLIFFAVSILLITFLAINVFKRMRVERKLREHRALLEEKVKERTLQLDNSNRSLKEDISRRKQAEEALRESEDFLNRTGDMAKVGGWEVDLNTMKVIWTRTTGRIHELPHGYFPDLEEAISYYHPDDQDHVRQCVQRAIESSKPFDFTVRLITAKGRERWIRALGQPIFDSGSCVRLSGTFQDITERLKLEEELRQSQKMEAIGNLAGGIAHEFNNVLGIILGNAELAIDDVPDWNPAKESLKEIRTASFRAKEVVRQILSFARKTMTALKPLEINTIVKESLKLIRASIPAMVDIESKIPPEPKMIQGDPTEIHQIIINLCTNSAHAMKKNGGVLEVGISEVNLSEKDASRYEDLSAGDFVRLTIKDSGEGISPEVLEKVFEPYFTTKEFGAGSGMGLAVVYGLVKKCKGAINIESTVEKGTTVEVLFPKIEDEAPIKEQKEDELPTGSERILLVDDDPSIVNMISQMLERMGYTVSSLTDSTSALDRFKSTPHDFDLVITDMSMPKMSGDQLAAELIKVRQNIPILLCTGHSDTIDERKAKQIGIKGFAMKPLDKGKLAKAVRAALDDR